MTVSHKFLHTYCMCVSTVNDHTISSALPAVVSYYCVQALVYQAAPSARTGEASCH